MTLLTAEAMLSRSNVANGDDSSRSRYLKLADGDRVEIIMISSPLDAAPIRERLTIWEGSSPTPYDPRIHAGVSPRRSYQIKIYNVELRHMQLLELGVRAMGDLISLVAEHGWGRWIYRLIRKGSGLTTTYQAIPLREVGEELDTSIAAALNEHDWPLQPSDESAVRGDKIELPF